MEIHIDTRRDSDEEIKKTIRFLQSLVGEETVTLDKPANVFETPSEAPMNMFGSSAPTNMFDTDAAPATNMFGNDDDAPSDYSPEDNGETVEEESIIEIVEY